MSERDALKEMLNKIDVQLYGLEPNASEDTRKRLVSAKKEIEDWLKALEA